ncbi:MAG TPA: DUF3089 domain-containing protein [Caulobacteraceae bacterium]|jgi:hypothetical protein
MRVRRGVLFWLALGGVGLLLALGLAAAVYSEDIMRTALDPREPYQTYEPPAAPDYGSPAAWARLPGPPAPGDPPVDVFFIHPTTYDGGGNWNAPIDKERANRVLTEVMLPNYAGPYQRIARVFAPRYRQASLYTFLTLREDARDARRFAYGDVRAAFQRYVAQHNRGRPFLMVGVEQGGSLADRLIDEEIAPDPVLRARFAGAHLIGVVTPAEDHGPQAPLPACVRRDQAGCVVAWTAVYEGEDDRARRYLERALVWSNGRLENLGERRALCVNPLLGAVGEQVAPASAHHGAANATRLEWGLRPAFLKREVAARCEGGVLRITRPDSPSLRRSGGWAERLRAPPFNLFYADLEADAEARIAARLNLRPDRSPPASRTAPTAPPAPSPAGSSVPDRG